MYEFAVIGCGKMAGEHIRQIKKTGRLAAVCDIDKERADKMALETNARAWSTIDELLHNEKSVQVIVICTPTGFHAEHCIKSLQAGKNVICETPLCITTAAAWQIMETAKFSGQKLVVVTNDKEKANPETISSLNKVSIAHHEFVYELSSGSPSWKKRKFPAGNRLLADFYCQVEQLVIQNGAVTLAKAIVTESMDKNEIDKEGAAVLKFENDTLITIHWQENQKGKKSVVAGLENSYNKLYSTLPNLLNNDRPGITSMIPVQTIEAIEKIYTSYKPLITE